MTRSSRHPSSRRCHRGRYGVWGNLASPQGAASPPSSRPHCQVEREFCVDIQGLAVTFCILSCVYDDGRVCGDAAGLSNRRILRIKLVLTLMPRLYCLGTPPVCPLCSIKQAFFFFVFLLSACVYLFLFYCLAYLPPFYMNVCIFMDVGSARCHIRNIYPCSSCGLADLSNEGAGPARQHKYEGDRWIADSLPSFALS